MGVEIAGAIAFPGILNGRRDIYTSVMELTEANVIDEVNSALVFHLQNVAEETYLYWYRRGLQPVLDRHKERNSFILNKIIENHAAEIVTFKNGYFLMEDACYVSRNADVKDKVDELNEFLYRSGKHVADNAVADWFHMVGQAALYVEPTGDKEVPIKAYALDPRSAFVVYSLRPGNAPVFGVNVVIDNGKALIDVYTKTTIFHLAGGAYGRETTAYPVYEYTASTLLGVEPNRLKHIPIIEYRYNSVNTGSFEEVTYLLDAINNCQSNRMDGVEQFIQSIAIAVNCQFEEGTTADKIREAGMIALSSIGENKADFRILSEELNQQQTQILVDNLLDQVIRICCMPTRASHGRGTYDTTGQAAIFNNGWEQAASAARNTEDLFKQSNRYFDEILIDVLKDMGLLQLKLIDFELNFVRNETANVQSKAQALYTLLSGGMNPVLAYAKSGISNDPVSDVRMSDKYITMIWGDPDAPVEEGAEVQGGKDNPAKKLEKNNGDWVSGYWR